MLPLTIHDFCRLTGAEIAGTVDGQQTISRVVIDSRQVRSGDVFFALPGEHCHGVEHAAAADAAGAVITVTGDDVAASCPTPCAVVRNPIQALGQLARSHRRHHDALVIGVTGSVGKTTARRLIASVLSAADKGIQSPSNFNNLLGLPLSLLQLSERDAFAVLEIGASEKGEIRTLAAIAEPEFGVVTRVAPAHLRGFESLRGIQHEKQKLVEALPETGVAFLNADDPLTAHMQKAAKGKVVLYGESADAHVRCTFVKSSNECLNLCVDSHQYSVHITGRHHVSSVLAAIAVGLETGMPPDQIQEGLDSFTSLPGRCCPETIGSWTLIDDAYNASPASVIAAADVLADWETSGRRIMVLGDMMDLGEHAEDCHFAVGGRLCSARIDHVLAFGQFAEETGLGFLNSGGSSNRISVFPAMEQLLCILDIIVSPNDVVLIKGSRVTKTERIRDWMLTQLQSRLQNRAAA